MPLLDPGPWLVVTGGGGQAALPLSPAPSLLAWAGGKKGLPVWPVLEQPCSPPHPTRRWAGQAAVGLTSSQLPGARGGGARASEQSSRPEQRAPVSKWGRNLQGPLGSAPGQLPFLICARDLEGAARAVT